MPNLICPFELKRAGEGAGDMTVKGYAAVFGNVDSYGDVIAPRVFADTIARTKSTLRPRA